jgi:hypothetical protein
LPSYPATDEVASIPKGIPEDELLLWAPIMADPPMATLKEMEDGTYSIEDIVDMNIMLRYKVDQIKKATKKNGYGN